MKTRDFKNTSEYELLLLYAIARDTAPEFKQYIQRLAYQGLPLVPAIFFPEHKGSCRFSGIGRKRITHQTPSWHMRATGTFQFSGMGKAMTPENLQLSYVSSI